MTLRNKLLAHWSRITGKDITFISPPPRSLRLEFPPEITSPQQKLVYALWREGTQPIEGLSLIIDDLNRDQINATLNELVSRDIVRKRDISSPRGTVSSLYSLSFK